MLLLFLLSSAQILELVEYRKQFSKLKWMERASDNECIFCYAMDTNNGLLCDEILALNIVNVNGIHPFGMTYLSRAAHVGDIRLVRTLVRKKANLNDKTPWSNEGIPLSSAIEKDHYKVVELLLRAGAEMRWERGSQHQLHFIFTAIGTACRESRVRIIKLLVKYGANIHDECSFGFTPVQIAVGDGNSAVAMYLIKLGVDFAPPNGHRNIIDEALHQGYVELAHRIRQAITKRVGMRTAVRVMIDSRRRLVRRRDNLMRTSVLRQSPHFKQGQGGMDRHVVSVIADQLEIMHEKDMHARFECTVKYLFDSQSSLIRCRPDTRQTHPSWIIEC